MTFGQLFSQVHPNIKVMENGTCVWLYIDDVNHYTFGADWWNAEIKHDPTVNNDGWIAVSERPPEDGSDILVYCDDGEETRITACNYYNGVWFDCVFNTVMVFKNITHWMPLPKPPKKDGEMG